MPSFKPKATKKIKLSKNYTNSLDNKHREIINNFTKNEFDVIPRLKEEKHMLTNKLEGEKKLSIDELMDTKDRIKEINNEIKNLKNKKTNYFLDNSKYIFEYFENKKNISNVEDSTKNKTSKTQILFNIFKIKDKDNKFEEKEKNKNSESNCVVQKYFSNIDGSHLDVNDFVRDTDICNVCRNGEIVALEDEGILICNKCAVSIPYLIENEKPSYKEPPKEVCFYAYKKINHFKEILSQFQGKETTQIPDYVIEQLKLQVKKERINIDQLTYDKTKDILKKLGFNKYYEHIAFIKNKMGIKPPVFSQELEDTLCNLFMEIQAPYSKTCPDYRVNFLHYYYVLFKFCELLGEEQYLYHIPLLKDRDKLIEQDETWKKMCMCDELNWEFIPTV